MHSTCPVCSSDDYKVLGIPKTNSISESMIKKKYNIVQCNNCKLYYVSPLIEFNEDQWSRLYNSDYFEKQNTWILKKRKKELSQRFDLAEKFLTAKHEQLNFLDIGTGEGKALLEGLNRNWRVTGIDIVDNRLESAKGPEIQFFQTNLLKSDLPENYFDFIYLDSVLEHVLTPLDYLLYIKRLLKKNGIVYIGVPNEDCLFNDLRKVVFWLAGKKHLSEKTKPFASPYHVIGFNYNSLNFLFNKAGFTTMLFRNFGRKFEFLGYSPKTKGFWINFLFLFPIEYLGKIIQRDVYFEAFLKK